MRYGVVQFGKRFPAGHNRDEFAAELLISANVFVAAIEQRLQALLDTGVEFEGKFSRRSSISVSNQWVELSWRYGDTLVFARLYQNGRPYAIAWVEYEE